MAAPGRYVRNKVLQVQLEVTEGTDPGSWAATHNVLMRRCEHRIDPQLVPRELIRPDFGGSEDLVGTGLAEIEFDFELQSSGAAGTAPAWGVLAKICGMAETVTAGNRVEYTPVSTGFSSGTFRYFLDGVRYVSRGARGNLSVKLDADGIPIGTVKLLGFDTNAAAASLPSTDFSAWIKPTVVNDGNSASVLLGCTYSAGALSGGTALAWSMFSVDLGNQVEYLGLVGAQGVGITDRPNGVIGALQVALTASEEATWRSDINSATTGAIGVQHGSGAGYRVGLFGGKAQRVRPQNVDMKGLLMMSADLKFLPTSGNDDIIIVAR
jgi:hypothetical protein